MDTPASFYCIRLINKDGTRGWIFDSKNGIKVMTDGVHSDITQFETEEDARQFIRDKKIERNGVKAYIRTNQELLDTVRKVGEQGISAMDKPTYHLENQKGYKCFYDSKIEGYFFKEMGEFGFPVWQDEESLIKFVRVAEFQEGMIFIIKHDKEKKERKLIQVYGRKQEEEGEPKHIQIEGDEWKEY